jgi:hypothetical protein
MTTEHRHEEKPWQPTIECQPEVNPFVNPLDRTGQLEHSPPLQDVEPEKGASAEGNRIAAQSARTTAAAAPDKRGSAVNATAVLIEPAVRHARIAQAAYFLSERRSFCPGGEFEDWLAAEAEIDRLLAPKQAAG